MNDTTQSKKTSFPFKAVVLTIIGTLALIAAGLYFSGWRLQRGSSAGSAGSTANMSADIAPATLYTCGMHPQILSEEPGDCPICGMKLTPKRDMGSEGENINGVNIKIDPVTQQNMGLRTAIVEKGPLKHTIRTYGHITYDETRIAQISPKFSGWFEKLYADFTGQFVKKGDPLFDIYSPELLAAQEGYLIALRTAKGRGKITALARRRLTYFDVGITARRRLSYFDVGEDEIRAIEKSGEVNKSVTIRSPFTGVITHKNAVQGGSVKPGMIIYKIADLSRVWVEAHIYEYELSRIALGQDAEMTLPYQPGKVYSGKVAYINPYLQQKTRDVVIRLEFENPEFKLKPDMYADVYIKSVSPKPGLIIPSEAVIRSGERNVVFVTREENKFKACEVTLGMALDGGKQEILAGLKQGDLVVTSGQFLLDSESKLKEAVQKMMDIRKGGVKAQSTQKEDDNFFDDMESDDDFFKDMESEAIK